VKFRPELSELETREVPVTHVFSAATVHSDSPNAAGSPTANAAVREATGQLPALFVGIQNAADGSAPAEGGAPGRSVNPAYDYDHDHA
jgi:hypothetical protein